MICNQCKEDLPDDNFDFVNKKSLARRKGCKKCTQEAKINKPPAESLIQKLTKEEFDRLVILCETKDILKMTNAALHRELDLKMSYPLWNRYCNWGQTSHLISQIQANKSK